MKPKIKAVFIVFVLILMSHQITAQKNIQSLDDCIRYAMENNFAMKSGRIAIERSKDLQGTAFNIERTNFAISQDPTSGGSPDNSISLTQGFEFPTIYFAQKNLLKAETKLERSNLEVTRNQLIKEVTGIYYSLLYTRENIKILQEQDSIYKKFLFLASTKYKLGETSRLEEMNAERLYNENKIELQKANKNYENIQLLLQQWLNTELSIEPKEEELPILDLSFEMNTFIPENTPIGQVYLEKLDVGEKNLSVVKQGYLPGFNITLKNQMLIKGFNPYNIDRERFDKGNFMGFEVGVSIPLFFGEQRAKTKAAKREIEISRIQKDEIMLVMRKGYQTSINDYLKAKNSLTYFIEKGKRQANDMARISQISYEKGEIDYVEYIQNLKTSVEVYLQHATAINEYNQSIITLNYLSGNKLN